jgi:uncharacterized protein YndB with AHSA1/START domain
MQRKGALDLGGEYATLTLQRRYRHASQQVWEAIATAEGLREWLLCTHAAFDGRVGGRFNLVSGPFKYRSTGKILAWEPPRVPEYQWNIDPVPEMPRGERAIFRYELTSEGDWTHMLVTYRRLTKPTAPGFLPGLHAFLDRLEAQLDQRDQPDWMQRFGERRAEYPDWSEHAADPGK